MKKLLLVLVWVFSAFNGIKGQNYHEIGIGFSGLHVWEINPPEYIIQDLNYYYNPRLFYQFHFLDKKVAIGTAIGVVNEQGSNEGDGYYGYEVRDDVRRSVMMDLYVGANLLETKKGYIHLMAGMRASRTYFFSHDSKTTVNESSMFTTTYETDRWRDVQYGMFTSLFYQHQLMSKKRDKNSLNLRVAWDLVYFFPEYRTALGFENNFASIATGPSVSLVWRIRGKKNTGLF